MGLALRTLASLMAGPLNIEARIMANFGGAGSLASPAPRSNSGPLRSPPDRSEGPKRSPSTLEATPPSSPAKDTRQETEGKETKGKGRGRGPGGKGRGRGRGRGAKQNAESKSGTVTFDWYFFDISVTFEFQVFTNYSLLPVLLLYGLLCTI